MTTPASDFEIATADFLQITDREITDLLTRVYIAAGFTTAEDAATMFAPEAVRQRGVLIGARDKVNAAFAGMVIVVPPGSPARRLAGPNEAELHLLGVQPAYRRCGLGRRLLDAAIANATALGVTKIILWTQFAMTSAQALYESSGFVHVSDFERNGRSFKLYERALN